MSNYAYTDRDGDKLGISSFLAERVHVIAQSKCGRTVPVYIPNADVPTVALELLKAAGQESVIVPKASVGEVVETHDGHLMIDGQTYPARLSYWEASEGPKARGLADAIKYAAKVDAALAFLRGKASAREAVEKAEAEAAEKELQERRDAIAKEIVGPAFDSTWVDASASIQRAINLIIDLEDKLAAK